MIFRSAVLAAVLALSAVSIEAQVASDAPRAGAASPMVSRKGFMRRVSDQVIVPGRRIDVRITLPPSNNDYGHPSLRWTLGTGNKWSQKETEWAGDPNLPPYPPALADKPGLQEVSVLAPYLRPGSYELQVVRGDRVVDALPITVDTGRVPGAVAVTKRVYRPEEPVTVRVTLPRDRYYYGQWYGPNVVIVPIEVGGRNISPNEALTWWQTGAHACGNGCGVGLVSRFRDTTASNPHGGAAMRFVTDTIGKPDDTKNGHGLLLAPSEPGRYEVRLYDRGWPWEFAQWADLWIAKEEIVVQPIGATIADLLLRTGPPMPGAPQPNVVLRNDGPAAATDPRVYVSVAGIDPRALDIKLEQRAAGAARQCSAAPAEAGKTERAVVCRGTLAPGEQIELPIQVLFNAQPKLCGNAALFRARAAANERDGNDANNSIQLKATRAPRAVRRVWFVRDSGVVDQSAAIMSTPVGPRFRVVVEHTEPLCSDERVKVDFQQGDGTSGHTMWADPDRTRGNVAVTGVSDAVHAYWGDNFDRPVRRDWGAKHIPPLAGEHIVASAGDQSARLNIDVLDEPVTVILEALGPNGLPRSDRTVRHRGQFHAVVRVPPGSALRGASSLPVFLVVRQTTKTYTAVVRAIDPDGDGEFRSDALTAGWAPPTRINGRFAHAAIEPDASGRHWLEVKPAANAVVRIVRPPLRMDDTGYSEGAWYGYPLVVHVEGQNLFRSGDLEVEITAHRAGQLIGRTKLRARPAGAVAATDPIVLTDEAGLGSIRAGDVLRAGVAAIDAVSPEMMLVDPFLWSTLRFVHRGTPVVSGPLGDRVELELNTAFSVEASTTTSVKALVRLRRNDAVLSERAIALSRADSRRWVGTVQLTADGLGAAPVAGDFIEVVKQPLPDTLRFRPLRAALEIKPRLGQIRGVAFEAFEIGEEYKPVGTTSLSSGIRIAASFAIPPSDTIIELALRSVRQTAAPRVFVLQATRDPADSTRYVTERIHLPDQAGRGTLSPGDRLEARYSDGPPVSLTLTGRKGVIKRVRFLAASGPVPAAGSGLTSVAHNAEFRVEIEYDAPWSFETDGAMIVAESRNDARNVRRSETYVRLTRDGQSARYIGLVRPGIWHVGDRLTVDKGLDAKASVVVTAGTLAPGKARIEVDAQHVGSTPGAIRISVFSPGASTRMLHDDYHEDVRPGPARVTICYVSSNLCYEESFTLRAGEIRAVRVGASKNVAPNDYRSARHRQPGSASRACAARTSEPYQRVVSRLVRVRDDRDEAARPRCAGRNVQGQGSPRRIHVQQLPGRSHAAPGAGGNDSPRGVDGACSSTDLERNRRTGTERCVQVQWRGRHRGSPKRRVDVGPRRDVPVPGRRLPHVRRARGEGGDRYGARGPPRSTRDQRRLPTAHEHHARAGSTDVGRAGRADHGRGRSIHRVGLPWVARGLLELRGET